MDQGTCGLSWIQFLTRQEPSLKPKARPKTFPNLNPSGIVCKCGSLLEVVLSAEEHRGESLLGHICAIIHQSQSALGIPWRTHF